MAEANSNGYVVILITAGSAEEARCISRMLLEKRKAACVNIILKISSSYRWQGKIESTEENLLVVKTRTSLADEVIDLVKSVHSYEVPEIIALPILAGNPDYLDWIGKETGE